ncbi:MAG: hypothetical protein ACM3O3_10370 [Syntrophothermus sp.]
MIKILRFLILVLLAWGCQAKLNTNKTYLNDNIPNEILSEISPLDSRVIQAIKANHPNDLKDIISAKLLENAGNKLDSIFNVTSGFLKEVEFKKMDYLYVVNAVKDVSNTIFSGLTNENDYIIHYKALEKDIFISLYRAKFGANELLITLIYGNSNGGWKLYHIQFGTYSLYDKTAIDYFKIAQKYDSLGYLIDAANALFFAQQTLKPGNQLWQYQKEKDIIELQKKLMDKINSSYKFPLTIEQVKTKPQVYNIYPQTFNDRYETIIKYYSHIDLKDTIQLKAENFEIRKVIGDVFKGIDKGKNYLIYQAANELPDGTIKQIPIYGFVQEFKDIK